MNALFTLLIPSSVSNESMPMRNDKVENDNNSQEQILSNAPEKKSGFFVVPKVVE